MLFFFLGVFAPSLVAVWLTSQRKGRAGINTLLRRMFQWRVGLRSYVFAFTFTVSLKLITALVYRLVWREWPPFDTVPFYVMVWGIVVSTPVQAGEEVGWRGYALPRLAARLGLGRAGVLLGVIWATWHLPLFFIPGTDTTGQSFLPYLLAVTALSVAMAWLYARAKGSLLLTMLMHAVVNNTHMFSSFDPNATNPFAITTSPVAWLFAGLLWICALYFLAQMRKNPELTREMAESVVV